ncbi:hypothetical protein SteCoe_7805 [Stentor coeruleus]|uniref:Protein kinase domain-containing protein n=1 Tax=Stentor coeruleus TaxID=5963 RepID=A0A1R2CLN1_9CILI|nr:hypothetical protein SteCoe_7805 [Stentor coeruleus]
MNSFYPSNFIRIYSHPKFTVYVCQETRSNGAILKKLYNFENLEENLQIILKEIELNNKLKSNASPDNCFLSYFESQIFDQSVILSYEYYTQTLFTYISNNQTIPLKILIKGTENLLNSLQSLKSLNYYHGNITPNAIMITPNQSFKLKCFVPCELEKQLLNISFQGYVINGSRAYLAPELLDKLENGIEFGEFEKDKADVFSVGLCIFHAVTLKPIFGKNYKEKNKALLNDVETLIEDHGLKGLLKNMLCLCENRYSFTECLLYLNGSAFKNSEKIFLKSVGAHVDRLEYENPEKKLEVWTADVNSIRYIFRIYDSPNPELLESLNYEYEILVILEKKESTSNLYLNTYPYPYDKPNKIIMHEFIDYPLEDLKKNINDNSQYYKYIIEIFPKLINFFFELEDIGIYHRDICLKNIRYNKDKLKVTGYSSAIKFPEGVTCLSNQKIITSVNYMAPELKEKYKNKEKYELKKPNNHDVFSLGITLAELISRSENISEWNDYMNTNSVISYIRSLTFPEPEIITNICWMLSPEPEDRPTFKRLNQSLTKKK